MKNNQNNSNNRRLYSEELYQLLKKLGVVGNFPGSKDKEFIELYRNSDGVFGNPADSKSMNSLIKLISDLGVDIYNEENNKIIKEAVWNKKDCDKIYTSSPKPGLIYENPIYQGKIPAPVENVSEETTSLKDLVMKIMYDLGFDPRYLGFNLFGESVLFILQNEE